MPENSNDEFIPHESYDHEKSKYTPLSMHKDLLNLAVSSEQYFPEIFEGINIDDIVSPIMFFLFREYYYKNSPANSYKNLKLKKTISGIYVDEERQRKELSSAIKKAYLQKLQDCSRLHQHTDYYEDTLTKKQSERIVDKPRDERIGTHNISEGQPQVVKDKSEIYHLRDIEARAIATYLSSETITPYNPLSPMVTALRKGTFVNTKKASGKVIAQKYKEFYDSLMKMNEKPDSQLWLENLIDYANIESQMGPSFMFALTKYLDRNDSNDLGEEVSILINYPDDFTSFSILGMRDQWIESCYGKGRSIAILLHILEIQKEALYQYQRIFDHKKCFRNMGSDEICSYFKEHYNLFRLCTNEAWTDPKTWSPSFVKKYRFVVSQLTESGYAEAQKIKGKGQQVSVPRSEDIDTNCAE